MALQSVTSYYKLRQETVITRLLQSATEVYQKKCQVLQNVPDVINYNRSLLQSAPEISKMWQTVISASGIPKCDIHYKMRRNIQYCLLILLQEWTAAVDMGKCFRALLADLSKTFDCFPQDIPLTKWLPYGFNVNALRITESCLFNRKQQT